MTSTGPGDVQHGGGEPVTVKAAKPVEAEQAPDGVRPGTTGLAGHGLPGQATDRPPGGPGRPPPDKPSPEQPSPHDPSPGPPLSHAPSPDRPSSDKLSELPLPLRAATRAVAALLVAVSLLHVLFVFLHVAPANPLSQRYARQIQAWVYPLFEQNWRLFAPDPESSVPQISVRTVHDSANGSQRISGWFDLTAVDVAAVRHSVFPSHTAQNMLRRAWTGYLESHGNSDVSYSDGAVMWQQYLRNIAVDRVGAARSGTIAGVQLRVRTRPIAGYDAAGRTHPVPASAVETRYLPWWKVTTHDH